jgi:hypothetical protein
MGRNHSQPRATIVVAALNTKRQAALRLGRIGFDHIAGYLATGYRALDRGRI